MGDQVKVISMHGAEIEATFGDSSVLRLEQEFSVLEAQLSVVQASLGSETDADEIARLAEQADLLRADLSRASREINRERRSFSDIAQGRKVA